MAGIFLKIVNMSISACWIVLAVVLLRVVLKKAPKWINCILWGIAGLRLVMPFSFESIFSLIPSAETISKVPDSPRPHIESGVSVIDSQVNRYLQGNYFEGVSRPTGNFVDITTILAIIWVIGIVALLIYTLVSFFKLKSKIGTAVLLRDNIYQSEAVVSPFVLGIIKPKIFLPFNMDEQNMEYVIAHEQAHLRRKDHLWKPLGFLILTLHWFNPMVWFGYILLCRDIELACDEKVVKELNNEQRADYSEALLTCSVNRRMIAACPLAFGEVGVKDRVKSVLNYKKPAFWIIVVSVVVSAITAFCFLTNPKKNGLSVMGDQMSGSDLSGISLEILSVDLSAPDPYLEIEWTNETTERILFGEQFTVFYNENGNWENCSIIEDPVWTLIGYEVRSSSSSKKTYHLNGQIMTRPGQYRFEAPFSIVGEDATDKKAWIEFELKEGTEGMSVHTFDPVELVYIGGSYSYVQTAETAPLYQIVNDMYLYEIYEIVYPCGKLESIQLDYNNFDSRFSENEQEWTDGYSLNEIKKNNKRVWQVYKEKGENTHLYLLLEQKDGTFYIGVGYADMNMVNPRNTDRSIIRWLYRLEKAQENNTVDISMPAVDGAVYYYPETTLQTDIPTLEKFYQLSDSELQTLISQLKDSKWVWDNLVDRTEFYFDGQICYDGQWIYFGFEQGVFYCDEYFCSVADEAISLIKRSEAKATRYAPIGDFSTDDGTVIVPIMELERLKSIFPMYFNLDTAKGLEVYIWQMAANSYSCGLLPGRNLAYTGEELWQLHTSSASLDEMRSIIAYYMSEENITRNDVTINAVSMPHSSYFYAIDEEYKEKLNKLFWAELPFLSTEYSPVIDTAVFDIDGDGKNESCTLTCGPTSGLFTFKLLVCAIDSGSLVPEYFNIFIGVPGESGELSFVNTDSGMKLRLLTGDNKEIFYTFGVKGDNIALFSDGEQLVYWGEQGITSAFAPKQKQDIDEAISQVLKEKYSEDPPDGLIHTQSYKVVSDEIISGTPTIGNQTHILIEKVGLIVYNAEYSVQNGSIKEVQGVFVPTVIIFGVDENGSYVLKEYIAGGSGESPESSLLSLFPEDSAKIEEYSDELIKESLAQATEIFNNYR